MISRSSSSGNALARSRPSSPTDGGPPLHLLTTARHPRNPQLFGARHSFAPLRLAPPTTSSILRAQSEVGRRSLTVDEALSPESLSRTVAIYRKSTIQTERMDRLLLYLFQRQIGNRGQAHAMLGGTPINSPQLDEFFAESAASLRVHDISELGGPKRAHGALEMLPRPERTYS